MLGYVKAGVTALEAAGLLTKLLVAAGLIVSLLTAYGVWHHKVYDEGWYGALAAVARQDAKAIATATEYRARWKSCKDDGKRWDQTTGDCR